LFAFCNHPSINRLSDLLHVIDPFDFDVNQLNAEFIQFGLGLFQYPLGNLFSAGCYRIGCELFFLNIFQADFKCVQFPVALSDRFNEAVRSDKVPYRGIDDIIQPRPCADRIIYRLEKL